MKIQAIRFTTPSLNSNKPAYNSNKQNINFGFGEDYGDDSFLYDSDHSSDGNLLESLGLIVAFPIAWVQDIIKEKRAERLAQIREEKFDEIEHNNVDVDDDIDDVDA